MQAFVKAITPVRVNASSTSCSDHRNNFQVIIVNETRELFGSFVKVESVVSMSHPYWTHRSYPCLLWIIKRLPALIWLTWVPFYCLLDKITDTQ